MDHEAFKAWRKALGLTQAEAADALGISKPTVENYERGVRRDTGGAVEIPKHIALACAAIYNNLPPWQPPA